MQDAKTYWGMPKKCMQLARSMPKHRAKLLDMASVWADLAEKAEARKKKKTLQDREEPK